MPCTTILVGKNASYDGSTMIARNDDGFFDTKKLTVVTPDKQPKTYKSVIGHLTVKLPDNPLRYTATPNVNPEQGTWAANGINEANVAMTATETITSNPRVIGADPLVVYEKGGRGKKEKAGGIGEEDLVVLVLPYIRSAREGVLRLGSLLEQYGTYEENGIAFSDENEIWWLETIGGHHWIARRVQDEEYVIMPNQFGLDRFDFADAFGEKKDNLCSKDLREFIDINHLDLATDGVFSPRVAFGSHSDADHVYNTPRAWYMGRYFNPTSYKWDGEDADFTPLSDDIPWAMVPERKITVEDVKYILSSYYQGTPYNPYAKGDGKEKGLYRPIGISRTDVMAILQIRGYAPKEAKAVEWICFGSNAFNSIFPLYANTDKIPNYFGKVTEDVSTENLYWASRLIGVIADRNFGGSIQWIERYQNATANRGHGILCEYDKKIAAGNADAMIREANDKVAAMAKEESTKVLGKLVFESGKTMKNGFFRADN